MLQTTLLQYHCINFNTVSNNFNCKQVESENYVKLFRSLFCTMYKYTCRGIHTCPPTMRAKLLCLYYNVIQECRVITPPSYQAKVYISDTIDFHCIYQTHLISSSNGASKHFTTLATFIYHFKSQIIIHNLSSSIACGASPCSTNHHVCKQCCQEPLTIFLLS